MKRVEGAKPFVSHLCPVDPGVTLLACHKSFKSFVSILTPVTMIQQSGRGITRRTPGVSAIGGHWPTFSFPTRTPPPTSRQSTRCAQWDNGRMKWILTRQMLGAALHWHRPGSGRHGGGARSPVRHTEGLVPRVSGSAARWRGSTRRGRPVPGISRGPGNQPDGFSFQGRVAQ